MNEMCKLYEGEVKQFGRSLEKLTLLGAQKLADGSPDFSTVKESKSWTIGQQKVGGSSHESTVIDAVCRPHFSTNFSFFFQLSESIQRTEVTLLLFVSKN